MSFKYKVLERCVKAIDIKRIYNLPEDRLLEILKTKFRADDVPRYFYERFNTEKIIIDNRPLFKTSPKTIKNENVILFIHGGGGTMCPTPLHYKFAAKLVKNTGSVLYFPFYPLGPEASIADSMRYLDKVYETLLKEHSPDKITVIGDSAGAALSVSLCCHAKRKPGGLVLISPATGIAKNKDKMYEMEKQDIILSVKTIELTKKFWIKDAPLDGADFNTSEADYTDFPPIHLYYGTAELFYPYIGELTDKIKSCGADVTTHEGKDLCHDWVLIGIIREGQKALDEICMFIREER